MKEFGWLRCYIAAGFIIRHDRGYVSDEGMATNTKDIADEIQWFDEAKLRRLGAIAEGLEVEICPKHMISGRA
jgi:hypothetical protein